MASTKPPPSTEITQEPISLDPEEIQKVEEEENQQDGVRVAEAVTKTWSRKYLVVAYVR